MDVKNIKTSYTFRSNDGIDKNMKVIIEYYIKDNDYIITEVEIDDDRYDQYYLNLNDSIKKDLKEILVKELEVLK
jgi:hypothetical protein